MNQSIKYALLFLFLPLLLCCEKKQSTPITSTPQDEPRVLKSVSFISNGGNTDSFTVRWNLLEYFFEALSSNTSIVTQTGATGNDPLTLVVMDTKSNQRICNVGIDYHKYTGSENSSNTITSFQCSVIDSLKSNMNSIGYDITDYNKGGNEIKKTDKYGNDLYDGFTVEQIGNILRLKYKRGNNKYWELTLGENNYKMHEYNSYNNNILTWLIECAMGISNANYQDATTLLLYINGKAVKEQQLYENGSPVVTGVNNYKYEYKTDNRGCIIEKKITDNTGNIYQVSYRYQ